jgi:hypothetical protein
MFKGQLMKRNFKQRTIKFGLVSAFALVGASFGVSGHAATATANGTATVIAPMAITKTLDLRFGKFAPGATAGTVLMTTAGVRSATGGVVLSALNAGGAASFNVTGDTTATYAITLPASVTLTDGTNNMTLDALTSNPSGTGALTAGTQTLLVGGTLNVGISQVAGAYTAAFDVTVEYN